MKNGWISSSSSPMSANNKTASHSQHLVICIKVLNAQFYGKCYAHLRSRVCKFRNATQKSSYQTGRGILPFTAYEQGRNCSRVSSQ